jgi:hypothetical protein
MGVVFKARQVAMDRLVAVKVLRDEPPSGARVHSGSSASAPRRPPDCHANIVSASTAARPKAAPHV